MKGLRLATLAGFACVVALAQDVSEPSMKEMADSLLSELAKPATVQMREWEPGMQDAGEALLQRCLTAPDSTCKGLTAGRASMANVTVTISLTSNGEDKEAFSLDEGCQLQTVFVRASHATNGVCLMGAPPPRLASWVSTISTLIEGTDPPEYRYETRTVVINLGFLGGFSLFGNRNFRLRRFEELMPDSTKDDLPKCDAAGLQACIVNKLSDSCMKERNGKCVQQLGSFNCPKTREETQWACERNEPAACEGDDCPQHAQSDGPHRPDFAQAMMMLETARQAAGYLGFADQDPEELRVFHGTYGECRDKVAWGLGDCCRGGSPTETHNRAALAQLGVGLAIRGVEAIGSPHVHDMLFLSSDLARSLKGLNKGLSGLTSAVTPSLSLYGVEVGLSNGALTFGFDPSSFAIAVALAVISNLLECDQAEQLLGLRVGNGLCVQTANWCADRSWFGCKEERESYCCYNSRLAKVFAIAAKSQLGRAPNDCGGLSKEELEAIDFSAIDMSEVIEQFRQPGTDPDELLRRFQVANAGRYTTVTVNAPSP